MTPQNDRLPPNALNVPLKKIRVVVVFVGVATRRINVYSGPHIESFEHEAVTQSTSATENIHNAATSRRFAGLHTVPDVCDRAFGNRCC